MTHLSAAAMLILQLVVSLLLLLQLSTCSAVSQIADNFDGLADGSYMTSRSSSRPHNEHSFDMHYDNLNTDSDSNSIGSANNETRILRRGKRYLQFSKGSRMSWRTNGKNTLLKINTLYAYGYGFRANYPFPSIEEQKKDNAVFFRLFKRDLFSKLETALDGHGFDGRACMLKSFCTAVLDVDKSEQKSGMLFKLLKLVFSFLCLTTALAHNSTIPHSRAKRYLDIIETTRIFFRVNAKNNVIASPIVWAHGYGFRANTPVLVKRENRPFRRDTYELLHELIDRSGLDGRACVLKAYCTALAGDHGQGFLFKLLKYVFTLDEHEKRHMPHLREENCEQIMHSHCPLSFDSISPYTDDV